MKGERDFYEVLQVSRSAEPEVIKAAYWRLVRMYHPDVSMRSDVESRIREINRAYSILGDPVQREEYDREMGIEDDPHLGKGNVTLRRIAENWHFGGWLLLSSWLYMKGYGWFVGAWDEYCRAAASGKCELTDFESAISSLFESAYLMAQAIERVTLHIVFAVVALGIFNVGFWVWDRWPVWSNTRRLGSLTFLGMLLATVVIWWAMRGPV